MLISEEELERKAAELRARLSEAELGYLVGLVEGEASFDVYFDKRTERYYPRVGISNICLDILYFFKNKLNIGCISCDRKKVNSRDCYKWSIKGRGALIFIKLIFNSLFSCKRIKAALLLSLNKENKGRYAELINKQIKTLNGREEDLDLQSKKTDDCFFENLTPFQLGLIAGLTDSEGTISVTKKNLMRFAIVNTCPRFILALLKIIRGCGLTVYRPQRRRKIYITQLYNQKARILLEKIKGFLFIKQKQADLAIEFVRTLGRPWRHVSPEVRKKREELYWKLCTLNMRGRVYAGGPAALSPSILAPPSPLRWNFPRPLLSLDV